MRVFVLLSRIPYPLEKGDKLRAFNQIKVLSKENEIILCALNPVKKVDKQKAFEELQPYCRSVNFIDLPAPVRLLNIIIAFLKGLPLQVGYFYSRKARKKINLLLNEYKPDHIYCQLLRTAEYVKDIDTPKTLDYQDVFSYGVKRRISKSKFYLKPLLKSEYKRLVKYENEIFDLFDNKTIISEPDRNLIPHKDKDKIVVVRNGVDFDFFKPFETKKKYSVVFTGNMHYPPNVDAARFLAKEIMPLVWKRFPEANLLLAGADPDASVKALKNDKVSVSGWLDDIREAYASSLIFIAPMRIGTGLQNKLLEAMAMKIPSITTPLANEALKAKAEEEILVGKNAGELSNHIIRLLENAGFRENLAEKGYNFVLKNFSWDNATSKLIKLINSKSLKN
jgi:sugar transferase (PEP-CTERM/EpsH1 system associated)